MKVRFTARARRRAALVDGWWKANRPDAAALFEHELEEAQRKLSRVPRPGTRYGVVQGTVIYRLLLAKTQQHVYFSIDEQEDAVIVHTVWGARRGWGPKL